MSLYVYRAQLLNVVDGDTIDLRVDKGFRDYMFDRFRLAHIDAWEVRGEERLKGLAAKAAVHEWWATNIGVPGTDGPWAYIETRKDGRGKYGRWLAEVYPVNPLDAGYRPSAHKSLNAWLVEEGHAEFRDY